MGEYVAEGDLCTIPDNLTLTQFILDSTHPTRPIRKEGIPWFIDDTTGRKIGFEEIRSRVFGLANALSAKLNIRENDVVCIFGQNDVDYPIIMWAIHRLGAVVATANPASNAEELAYHLNISGSTSIITHPDILPVAMKAAEDSGIPHDRLVRFGGPERVTPNFSGHNVHDLIDHGLNQEAKFVECKLEPGEAKTKVAFRLFSSGTTGKPKAVELSHYAAIASILQLATFLRTNDESVPLEKRRFRPGHVGLCVLPMYHIYGIVNCIYFQIYCGLTVVIVPKFDFVRFLKTIVLYKVTHLMVVPPIAVLLSKHPATKDYDISHVRFILYGAAPVSAELQEQVVKVIPNAEIGQGYGMTETCAIVSCFPLSQRIGTPGSAGVFIPGVRARIVKPDGTLAKAGEPGELYVATPAMALRYHNNEKATNETFVDGWVRTGDEAMLNEKNELFVLDRVKEIMKVRAFQVAPAELEGHLLRHPDVADACVVGIPDEYSGELPLGYVVLSADAAKRAASGDVEKIKASIVKHVADNKAKHKHLQGGVEFISAIPKNPSGKLLRRVLRDHAKQLKARRAQSLAKL